MSKLKVFLDSNVLTRYLSGQPNLDKLFYPSVLSRVTYVVNPVVYQELLLAGSESRGRLDVAELSELLTLEQLDPDTSADFAKRVRSLRNASVHTNDLLVLGSAKESDYLLTYDSALMEIGTQEHIKAITPEDFLEMLDGVAV